MRLSIKTCTAQKAILPQQVLRSLKAVPVLVMLSPDPGVSGRTP